MNLSTRLLHGIVTCLALLAPLSAAVAQSGPVQAAPAAPPIVASPPQPPTAAADSGDSIDYTTARTELAGAPLIGGNSDIGFEFGLVLTATHFGQDTQPYRWNSDLVLAASIKGGPNGAEIAQQSYLLQVDVPAVVPDRVRVTVTGSFQRTVDYGYFGMDSKLTSSENGRFHQFDQREGVLRTLTRVQVYKPYVLLAAVNLRYVDPHAYADSQLSHDLAAGLVRGIRALGHGSIGVGVAYDTRDNEFFPRRGAFHQVGIKGSYAVPLSAAIGYASAGASLAGYVPVAGPLILAARGLIDAQAGHVPFYDLALGGIFHVDELPGGPAGIRGVPIGRYRGLIKMVANVELRALFWRFHLLGGTFHLGSDVFADVGGALRDYNFIGAAKGGSGGWRWGAGAGLYLQWGQAAVFRAEFAYSPDARANGGFPVGVYVAEGVMF